MVICMGAGDITKWAAALADGICDARASKVSVVATMPNVRGKLTPDAPLAPLVWFKSGGKAEWLFEPKDEQDLVDFLRELDPEMPVMALGLGSNLIVRDGGVRGRRGPPRKGVREDRAARRNHPPLRRRRERHPRVLDCARCGHCRARVPARYSRHRRRLRPDERRRLRPRGQRHPRFGAASCCARARWSNGRSKSSATLIATARCPTGAVVIEAMFRGHARRSAGNRRGDGRHRPRPRGIAAASQPHRRLDLQEPAGPQGVGAGRRRRCRGLTIGDAQVSEKHCNFLLNLGSATSAEIEALGEEVRRRVEAKTHISLEWEIQRVGSA